MKKQLFSIFLGLLLISLCVPNVSGQEPGKNTIYGGVGFIWDLGASVPFPGLYFEYERLLHGMFSIGVEIGSEVLVMLATTDGTQFAFMPYAEVKGRWYPRANIFFIGAAFGALFNLSTPMPTHLTISPGIGWRIDVGKNNKWVMVPGIYGRILYYIEGEEWLAGRGSHLKANFSVGYRF